MNRFKILINTAVFSILFIWQYIKWKGYTTSKGTKLRLYPRLFDKTVNTSFDRHYVYHVTWALERVSEKLEILGIAKHVDIGSSLYFVMALALRHKVEFVDVRPPLVEHPNLSLVQGDVTKLPYADSSVASLSILHVIEHLGLGRYGDFLDFEADKKAAAEISRVLRPGGFLFLVTPTGIPAIHFNAHKVYGKSEIQHMFKNFNLVEFSFLKELKGGIINQPSQSLIESENYGCGFYIFEKK